MKRPFLFIMICLMIAVLSACQTREALNVKEPARNTYSINLEYDPDNRTMEGNETLIYINNHKTKELYFHLYPNSYKDKNTSPEFISIPDSYPNGFNEGYIHITDVKINDTAVFYKVDESLMKIEVPAAMRQNTSFKVQIAFNSLLPDAKTRYGRYEGLTHCAYWYPILAVYNESGWDKTGFYPIGESTYSEVADYIIKITLPKNEIVCATGEKVEEKNIFFNNKKTVTYKEDNIRDFSWFSSAGFKLVEQENKGVLYRYYYTNENNDSPKEVLEQSMKVFDFYRDKFGNYPYKQFNIIKTETSTSEFPQAITITDANLKNSNLLRLALSHEIAHQWWYLAVGNNSYKEPWLDEALASYCTHLYSSSLFGDIVRKIDTAERYPDKAYGVPIHSSVAQFKTMSEYGDVVYNWGSIALDELYSYDFITTNGKKLSKDSDIYYYSNQNAEGAAYDLECKKAFWYSHHPYNY
jgi:hypothetical protein